jgi:hypothetical protein
MSNRRELNRVPKSQRCPQCGCKCLCDHTERTLQEDGREMKVQYRYCPVGCRKEDGTRDGVKEVSWIDY